MTTVLLVILIILLIGGVPSFGLHDRGWAPSGGFGVVLVILLILVFMGKL